MELIERVRSEHRKLIDICSLNDLSLFGYPDIKKGAVVDFTKIGNFQRHDRFKQVKIISLVINSGYTSKHKNFVLIDAMIAFSLDKNTKNYNQVNLLRLRFDLLKNKFDFINF